MKHIALISTSFPDQEPGSEAAGAFVADFATTLAQHTRVTVLAPARRAGTEAAGNLSVRRFAVPRLPLSLLQAFNPTHWPAILQTLRAGQQALDALADETHIDHILALWALPSGHWARRTGARHSIPYSCWALGSDIWSLGKIPLIRTLLQRVLKDSHTCFADGYVLKQDVSKLSGRSCDFLPSTRRLAISGEKQLRTAPPYRLAFLGRWHPNKGIDLLLDALLLLNDDDWRNIEEIRICGGGPLAEMVATRCKQLARAGRPVTRHGYLDRTAAAALLTWADYLVLPSRIESIPVIFSDALQSLCPVIATPVGDLPRLHENFGAGLLADAVSASAIATALRAALHHAPLEFAAGIGKARAQFDLDQACLHLLDRIAPAAHGT